MEREVDMRTIFTARVREGRVYLTTSDTSWGEPAIVTSFWPTSAPAHPEIDGLPVEAVGATGYFVRVFNREVPLNLTSQTPEFTETVPVKKPNKTGAWTWKEGRWVKQ